MPAVLSVIAVVTQAKLLTTTNFHVVKGDACFKQSNHLNGIVRFKIVGFCPLTGEDICEASIRNIPEHINEVVFLTGRWGLDKKDETVG